MFRSVNSMHILHFPLSFFTITMLASHSRYCISKIWLTSVNFFISSVLAFAFAFSSLSLRSLWILTFTWGLTYNRWQSMSGSMLGMSLVDQANETMLARSTRHNLDSVCWSRSTPIFIFLLGEILTSLKSPIGCGPWRSVGILGSSSDSSTPYTRSGPEPCYMSFSSCVGCSRNTSKLLPGRPSLSPFSTLQGISSSNML